jgi:uncharacterized protein HemX
MPAVVVAIVALLLGLGIGYVMWGSPVGRIQAEVTAARARIAELQRAAEEEGQLVTRIRDLEGQIKDAQAALQKEQELTAKLEAATAKKRR